jgi:leader peptidase (prepilin peptidase)/N-methyltransferase
MIIPNMLTYMAIPAGLVSALVNDGFSISEMAWNHGAASVAGPLALFTLREVYLRLRGIEGLGLGDVKLAGAAGAWLGVEALPMTCLLASSAAITAVLLHRVFKPSSLHLKSAIPFGSFIAPAIVVMWGLAHFV